MAGVLLNNFDGQVKRALSIVINRALKKAKQPIEYKIKDLFLDAVFKDATINSLLHGRLRGEVGLNKAQSRIDAILQVWVNSLKVNTILATPSFSVKAGYRIEMIQADYSDVFGLPEANVRTKDGSLPWLKWLLVYGNQIIVSDYIVDVVPGTIKDRSGTDMIMVPSKSGGWSVPPEFAGTSNNNFVTQIIDRISVEIQKIIIEEFTRYVV